MEIGQMVFALAMLVAFHGFKKLLTDRFDINRLEPIPAYLIGGIAS